MNHSAKKLDFNTKDKIINLSGTCFWYWNTLYSFLESSGVSVSIYSQFSKELGKYQLMRSLLEFLERTERYDLIQNIQRQFYNFTPTEENVDKKRAKDLLDDFRKSIGPSILNEEINNKESLKHIEEYKKNTAEKNLLRQKIQDIKNSFLNLYKESDKQKRGFALEVLFFDLLQLEQFEIHRPYKNPGEQIDGHFKYEKFDYIVEIKWTEEVSKQSDLSIFDGKIKGKAQSTRGLFLSMGGFDANAISKFSGDSPRIVLMDAQDFFIILEEITTFHDLMRLKTDFLVRKGEIYVNYK